MKNKFIVKAESKPEINNALVAFAKELGFSVIDDFPNDLKEGYISFGTSKKTDINYKTQNNPKEYYSRNFGIEEETEMPKAIDILTNEFNEKAEEERFIASIRLETTVDILYINNMFSFLIQAKALGKPSNEVYIYQSESDGSYSIGFVYEEIGNTTYVDTLKNILLELIG